MVKSDVNQAIGEVLATVDRAAYGRMTKEQYRALVHGLVLALHVEAIVQDMVAEERPRLPTLLPREKRARPRAIR